MWYNFNVLKLSDFYLQDDKTIADKLVINGILQSLKLIFHNFAKAIQKFFFFLFGKFKQAHGTPLYHIDTKSQEDLFKLI